MGAFYAKSYASFLFFARFVHVVLRRWCIFARLSVPPAPDQLSKGARGLLYKGCRWKVARQ
ncbi:hypothetical protein [Alloprevotella tannerae]